MSRLAQLERLLKAQGLDLLHAFRVRWYDDLVEKENLPVRRLSSFGEGYKVGILIGNSKSLWTSFVRALKEDAELRANKDPLDTYTQSRVKDAVEEVYHDRKQELFWSCDYGDRLVAMQRIAEVVLLEGVESEFDDLPAAPPPPLPCPVSMEELAAAKEAIDSALSMSDQTKLREELHGESKDETSASWRHWLRVRETVKLGQEFRYSDDQAEYHYTKNRLVLERAIGGLD
ncbi:hypothetical protein GUITHDRAFT_111871 [Guillardia theta CCMP2712]|uniref:Uncharacterized protein n=1 Tax=Guillardia theta (strain CCMP2712) TaxID=905079 RepID=L1J0I1_GUITC|nr:hypothetical protein GUITHDRAFT_111871 [Guillardia theta CCMP2712]EKX42016.1 hypothetical protein GUITHDRAFT_111871 [Guillardia theta CCMP2712]|eukprot:XP_005828996.1 hypothetical protein GUITHDRAFT_111871 [Guillardia theta CCMP2712]